MNLEKKIKHTETRIALENAYINHQVNTLKGYITPEILTVMALTSFAFGYLLSRNKAPPQVVKKLMSGGQKVNKLYQTIKFVLPMI